jgi:hypothetical protein
MPDIKCPATATAVLACTFVLSGTGALAQGNNAYRGIDTVAGKSHRLGVCGNVQKDCTSGPPPAIRVVVPPKHGELNVRSGNLKAGRITRCPNLRATAQGVFYQSKPKYSGTDEVVLGIREQMVVPMFGCPPQHTLLGAALGKAGENELEHAARCIGAVREIAMIASRDPEHP